MRTGCIYSLKDPNSNLVRYIGQTICKPNDRYAHHIYQWKRSIGKITHVNSWIKCLAKQNLKPIMEIIEEDITEDVLDLKEINYIKLFKAVGANLCNHSIGGNTNRGYKASEESKLKRLNTCKTSIVWKEKHIRHSDIMKEKHKQNPHTFGTSRLSLQRRKEIGKLIQDNNPRKRHIKMKNTVTNTILEFNTIKEGVTFFKCNAGTLRDFIFNIRKSIFFKDYILLENKNKYDVKDSNKKK
jgi:hypothetical protein